MAVTQTQTLPAPFLESISKEYATGLGEIAKAPLPTAGYAPGVVGQQALQQGATTLAGQALPGQAGLGGYQPYLTGAGAAGVAPGAAAQGLAAQGILGAAGTQLGAAEAGLTGLGAQYAAPAVTGLQGAQATLAGAPGVSGVQDYIGAAGTGLAGAGTAMGGVSPYITGAAGLTGTGAGTGAGSIASYMSPYQTQVIDTTLAEFDRQAAMRQQGISDAAVSMGGYGGGREGVMQSEYQLGSDRNRALLEAQMQQQGYGQAQQARQADMAAQLGIGGAQQQYASGLAGLAGARSGLAGQEAQFAQGQLGLGQATGALAQQQGALAQGYLAPGQFEAGLQGQAAGMAGQRAGLGQAQLGLGQYELGQAGALQGFQGTDIGRAGQVGAMDQAYAQAVDDAKREANRMALYEPMERMGYIGSGLSGLMQGMGPQYQFSQQPNASPLATALGIGSTLGGIYGNVMGTKT